MGLEYASEPLPTISFCHSAEEGDDLQQNCRLDRDGMRFQGRVGVVCRKCVSGWFAARGLVIEANIEREFYAILAGLIETKSVRECVRKDLRVERQSR
jgi:hypothetical protein